MAPWLRVLEAYMVQALLRTPLFHRGVEKVAKQVHRLRHGIPPEEMGGTKIDGQSNDGFMRHFSEEISKQLGRAEARSEEATAVKTTVKTESEAMPTAHGGRSSAWDTKASEDGETADAVWESARKQQAAQQPKQGFLDEYVDALREQLKNGK